jgi:hypothetical protein
MAKRFKSDSWSPNSDFRRLFETGNGSDFRIVCTAKDEIDLDDDETDDDVEKGPSGGSQIRETERIFVINKSSEDGSIVEKFQSSFASEHTSARFLRLDWISSDRYKFFDSKSIDFFLRDYESLQEQVTILFIADQFKSGCLENNR